MPICSKRVADLRHRLQERQSAVELAHRLVRVSCDHEDVAHADLVHSGDELGEVRPISHEPCGEVRHDGIAVVAELLDDVERVLDSPLRRHGHRQGELLRNVLDDRVDDAAERDHLVAWVLQELHDATGCQ